MSDRTSTAAVDRVAVIGQQTSEAGLALADLAKLNLPPIYAWTITWSWDLEAVLLEGLLAASVEDVNAALDAWAEVLETPQRQVKPWRDRPGSKASVIGVYQGVMVKIWNEIDAPGGAA